MYKVAFQTYGCSNNEAETEIMKGILAKEYEIVPTFQEADVIVLNVCTVKGDAQALSKIRKAKEEYPHKHLVVSGCVPKHLVEDIRAIDHECGILTTQHVDKIAQIVEQTINNQPTQEVKYRTGLVKLSYPRVRRDDNVGVIPISNSCLGYCTFCSVKRIKGKYYSFPLQDIVSEVKKAVKDGCTEIWLTSQDNACYGMDTNQTLAELLREVCKVEGDFMIRVGMLNPDYLERELDELIEAYKHPKIYKFLHICAQSGSDKILQAMKRTYTCEWFNTVCDAFRKEIPEITFATDIIVGFPGEGEKEIQETLDLVKRQKFDACNISKFRPRPKTPAHRMQTIHPEVMKDHSKRLTETFEKVSLERNKEWIGWSGVVLVSEYGRAGQILARNPSYKQVVLPSIGLQLGDKVKVKIVEAGTYHILGDVLEMPRRVEQSQQLKFTVLN